MNGIIGRNIARLRSQKGLSQADLADRLGIHQTAISKFELGQRRISVDTLDAFAQALETTPAELLKRPTEVAAPEPELVAA